MSISTPFIERPIGTTLLSIGLLLIGAVAYLQLPIASLPSIDFPTISVSAGRPGADPSTMAATVAAPLERRLGEIAGVTEITSVSSLGNSRISVQFDLTRKIDRAARDVQAAINAAASDLPGDLPQVPTFKKHNPSAAPVLILALTSENLTPSAIYDAADSVLGQRISQVSGVADVTVSGAEQPAMRVRVNPGLLASIGVSMEDVRAAVAGANASGPIGVVDGDREAITLGANDQLDTVDGYKRLVVKLANGNVVHLSDVASVARGVRNTRASAMFNNQPAVLLIVTKQADANVIATVDRVKALLPELQQWIPAGIKISILADRTQTIRASVGDMERTLGLAALLVMLVVAVFLRQATPTIAAGITVPLSLAGTCALMWAAGFSVNNLTLMALAVSIGFVVDDAIVMIENVYRNIEAGKSPMQATLIGARQIGFTVVSISISLLAAFIPLLFMGGVVGRLLREFSLTLVFAIVVSTIVSLTVTPMICAHFITVKPKAKPGIFDRLVDGSLDGVTKAYGRTLDIALGHRFLGLLGMLATVALTVQLYVASPKGYFPQDDTGLMFASTEASADVSYAEMVKLQGRALEIVLKDPAVAGIGSSLGAGGFNASVNQGRMFISLKPLAERGGLTTAKVIDRMRPKLDHIAGLRVFLVASQDIRTGGRQSKSQYQYTLWDPDYDELVESAPKVLEALRKLPELTDVTTDREQGGLQASLTIDRDKAARLGVAIGDIDNTLNDAYSQRQISTIYGARNQYQVIVEVDPRNQSDPQDLSKLYVPANVAAAAAQDGMARPPATQVPLTSLVKVEKTLAPLVVNHQGPFPSLTVTYNLAPGAKIQDAARAIDDAIQRLGLPGTLHAEPAGDAKDFAKQAGAQPLLILAALVAVYIVLGVLYESLAHPLTIISTLPSAGLGALIALQLAGLELSVIAFIGIILLIGIVKKNGIMLVDFALEAERVHGLSPAAAIREACLERFRPILMTTLAAVFGAVPLAIATGPGSELRRPLGIAIIGGLVVSQVLTLYTTPIIYLMLDKLHRNLGGGRERDAGGAAGHGVVNRSG